MFSALRNTSMAITNLIGPKEKMMMADHPVKTFYFMLAGAPQSLRITMVGYMGKLRVTVGVEKGFINPKVLTSCFQETFTNISQAAIVGAKREDS
ncbi:hypothetical protein AMTRI_Chr01g134370 [Amborella trichopoda]